MADEVTYVEFGDEFDDTSWKHPDTDFQTRFLKACGRKYYDTQVNARKVRTIEKKMSGKSPKYPHAFVEKIIVWAIGMNTPRITRSLKAVISAVRNPDNLAKFYRENPKEVRNFDNKADFDW